MTNDICTTVELFCGIGGFRIAADQRKIDTIWANDRCPKACQVYRDRSMINMRFSEMPFLQLWLGG
ncbi:DNA cytosine methyltransferase [Coleofasciculus sp. E2-BRE-01]|uniref:DNA cytosine methyltransferase n=1 Tax=Coleofasciculus sp. E2-BRE-01 TaxID=3069524 RepID=UPI0032F93506